MSDVEQFDYKSINALAKELGRPAGTLIALSPHNDPFWAGVPARQANAEWFAEIWSRFGFGAGIHLRRIHYLLISQPSPVVMRDGSPYENTTECSAKLNEAAKSARNLRLVDPANFVDRRNSEAVLAELIEDEGATVWLAGADEPWPAPTIEMLSSTLPGLPSLTFASPTVAQRYAVEIWVEKSTINDILDPLHRQYGVNIVPLTGESSDTRCQELVDRALEHGRPVRVLYISDFDPAGQSMPVAVARKIEHRLRTDGLELDIQVRPVALTPEQCVEYRLPRTPIKATEQRAGRFEERFGEGATELDALEALHPGVLRDILTEEIERYYDGSLDEQVEEVAAELGRDLDDINDEARSATEIRIVERDYSEIVERINNELRSIAERYKPELQAIADRFSTIRETVADRLREEAPDPDGYDWPEPDDSDEDDDPLFDSSRDYVEQIDRYKEHQGKPTARRNAARATP
jgi:hypothetical protein